MLVLLTADLFKPDSVSAKDFYEVWKRINIVEDMLLMQKESIILLTMV